MWLLLGMGPLLFFQRALHREMQSVFLLLFRRADVATLLFSLLFLPGVLLHELSHWLMALLLGVKVYDFSVLPQAQPGGKLQLGFVVTQKTDWLRESLIGAAPLLAGGAFVAYSGWSRLQLPLLGDQLRLYGPQVAWQTVGLLYAQADFWIWAYLTLAVSSTMLPSASDRNAWGPVGLIALIGLGLALLLGAGPWLMAHWAEPINQMLRTVAVVTAIGAGLHAILWLPCWLVKRLLMRLTGLEVVA
jgi:hypothetical protein